MESEQQTNRDPITECTSPGGEPATESNQAPLHVKYPDLTEEEDARSLLEWFGMMSPEDRIQSAVNVANLAANARRKHPDQ